MFGSRKQTESHKIISFVKLAKNLPSVSKQKTNEIIKDRLSKKTCTHFLIATHWAVVVLAMIGKLVTAAAFATVYLFTAELFPTVVRSTTMGVSAFFSGVGGMLAPYIVILVSIFTI